MKDMGRSKIIDWDYPSTLEQALAWEFRITHEIIA